MKKILRIMLWVDVFLASLTGALGTSEAVRLSGGALLTSSYMPVLLIVNFVVLSILLLVGVIGVGGYAVYMKHFVQVNGRVSPPFPWNLLLVGGWGIWHLMAASYIWRIFFPQ